MASYKADQKRQGDRFFCSRECLTKAKTTSVKVACLHCGTKVLRRPSQIKGKNVFCSRSCSNQGRTRVKKTPTSKCNHCGDRFPSKRSGSRKVCDPCKEKRRQNLLRGRSKGDMFKSSANWQSARSSIQRDARKTYFREAQDPHCVVCGYRKHVEVCHRRDVADFPDDALIEEVNTIDNLVGLCPTHHWEFDHNALDEPLPVHGGTG